MPFRLSSELIDFTFSLMRSFSICLVSELDLELEMRLRWGLTADEEDGLLKLMMDFTF
jgi:hypothetical protein